MLDMAENPYALVTLSTSSSTIRLLSIHRVVGIIERFVSSSRLAGLSNRSVPQYSALSYLWAKEVGEPQAILCGGAKNTVSGNCYSALIHLRQISDRY